MDSDLGGIAPALEVGLELIEYVCVKDEPVSFKELEKIGTSKSTLNRLLKVLCAKGYLAKSGRGYSSGVKCNLFGVSGDILKRLEAMGGETVRDVCSRTANTAILFYFNGSYTQVVSKDMNENSIVMQPVGNISEDFTGTPWGWILLDSGDCTPKVIRKHTGFMKTADYQERIAFYHKHGFTLYQTAINTRLAAPILQNGKVVAVLGLGGNSLTIAEKQIADFGQYLLSAAQQLQNKII